MCALSTRTPICPLSPFTHSFSVLNTPHSCKPLWSDAVPSLQPRSQSPGTFHGPPTCERGDSRQAGSGSRRVIASSTGRPGHLFPATSLGSHSHFWPKRHCWLMGSFCQRNPLGCFPENCAVRFPHPVRMARVECRSVKLLT